MTTESGAAIGTEPPTAAATAGHPVLSVRQTDIIYYALNPPDRLLLARATVPFWKDLVG